MEYNSNLKRFSRNPLVIVPLGQPRASISLSTIDSVGIDRNVEIQASEGFIGRMIARSLQGAAFGFIIGAIEGKPIVGGIAGGLFGGGVGVIEHLEKTAQY